MHRGKLIERGRLAFDMPLSQALARTLARLGRPADPRLLSVTVSELLVHRAGFDGKKDEVNAPLAGYLRNNTARRTAFDTQLGWLLREQLTYPPGTHYAYSNAAYLVLGARSVVLDLCGAHGPARRQHGDVRAAGSRQRPGARRDRSGAG